MDITDVAAVPLLIEKSTTTPSLSEPGGTFIFSVDITNPSTVDTATITALSDTYGDLSLCVTLPYDLAPGQTITCDFTADHFGNAGDSFDNYVTVTATDDDDANVGGDSNTVTVDILARIGYITPTDTTCEDVFITQTFSELPYVDYKTKGGKINSISPGVFFYYTRVEAPSNNFDIEVTQWNMASLNQWPHIGIQKLNQVVLYDDQCVKSKVQHSVVDSDGTQVINVNDVMQGQVFYIGIKYDPGTLKQEAFTPPSGDIQDYHFLTSVGGIPNIRTQAMVTVQPK